MLKEKLNMQEAFSTKLHKARRVYFQSLKNAIITTEVSAHLGYQFRGDFYGLLKEIDIPNQLHLLTLEINNLESSLVYDGFTKIKIIEDNVARKLATMRE